MYAGFPSRSAFCTVVDTAGQGEHAAIALCVAVRDTLTHHWALHVASALGPTCDAAMQAVVKQLKALPHPCVLHAAIRWDCPVGVLIDRVQGHVG
jgi:hypothetical protein